MGIRLKLTLLLCFLFFTAIINAVFTFALEGYGEEKLQWVNHTHEVLLTTEKLISSLKDAETGQRGFIITRNASYLEPYNSGVGGSKVIIEELKY